MENLQNNLTLSLTHEHIIKMNNKHIEEINPMFNCSTSANIKQNCQKYDF